MVSKELLETDRYGAGVEKAGVRAWPIYGIIDPDYARVFTIARAIAWQEGYALMMHGSFTRDLDLLAVPWTEKACPPSLLIARIIDSTGLRENGHPPGKKPHHRQAWTLLFPDFTDPRFVDIGVMARDVDLIHERNLAWSGLSKEMADAEERATSEAFWCEHFKAEADGLKRQVAELREKLAALGEPTLHTPEPSHD